MEFSPTFTMLIVFAIGSVFILSLYIHDRYSLLYYGDAVSHLFGSRKLVDWDYPGLNQLGTVWLPITKFLFLLPAVVDPLFFTGLAGSIVNLSALALTTYIIHSMKKNVYLSLLYPLNPNILYLSVVAMTEAPFMLFFTASALYIHKFKQNNSIKSLIISASFIALATLTRYEGWILPIFLLIYILKRPSPSTLLAVLIAFSGILTWLLYNFTIYGDVLEFANATYYSAAWQAAHRNIRDMLMYQPLNVLIIYGVTAAVFYGPLISMFFMPLISRSVKKEIVYLCLPMVFTLATLIGGVGEMNLWWFNSRFVILLAPLLISLANPKRIVIIATLLYYVILIPIQYVNDSIGIITYVDARAGYEEPKAQASIRIGEFLREYADKTKDTKIMIITGSAQEHRIILASWMKLSTFDEIIDSSTWKDSFKKPWLYADIIVLGKQPDSDAVNVASYWLDSLDILSGFYINLYEDEYYIILKRV